MKVRNTIVLLGGLLLLPPMLSAQLVDTAWVRRFDGRSHLNDAAAAIAVDLQGCAVVTGTAVNPVTNRDMVTVRYKPDGETAWVRTYAGDGTGGPDSTEQFGTAVTVDNSGHVVVTGVSYRRVTNSYDIITIKYSPAGAVLWSDVYAGNSTSNDVSCAVALDGFGNVYVGGTTDNPSNNRPDYLALKYTASGARTWIRLWDSPGNREDTARALALDGRGNAYVTGKSHNGMNTNCVTVKFRSSDGAIAWSARIDSAGANDWGNALVTGLGSVFVAGRHGVFNNAGGDYVLARIDTTNGAIIWRRMYGGIGADEATALAIDALGNCYVTGYSTGTGANTDFYTLKYDIYGTPQRAARYDIIGRSEGAVAIRLDAAANVYVTGPTMDVLSMTRTADYVTLKYDSSLNHGSDPTWAMRYNGPLDSSDTPCGLGLDNLGNVYVTGSSWTGGGVGQDYCTIKYGRRDVGCFRVFAPPALIDSGTSWTPACSVANYGTTVENYLVRMCIGTLYSQTMLVTGHNPGTRRMVTFPAESDWARGTHAVVCSTMLGPDMNRANDQPALPYSIRVRVLDMAALAVVAPTGVVESAAVVTPQGRFVNPGSETVSCSLEVRVGAYRDFTWATFAPGETRDVAFPDWMAKDTGTLVTKCSTRLKADIVPGNNQAVGTVRVVPRDVAVKSILRPVGGVVPDQVVTPQILARNRWPTRTAVKARFTIGDLLPVYDESLLVAGGLPSDRDTILTFPAWTAVVGRFLTRCSLYMENDRQPANDTLGGRCAVGINDGAVSMIIRPLGSITPGKVVPTIRVRNYGSLAIDIPAMFSLTSGAITAYADTQTAFAVAPGTEATVSFDTATIDTGTFLAKAKCEVYSDSHPANDSMLVEVVAAWPPPGWSRRADFPAGPKAKRVKEGGALAVVDSLLYAFKGANTNEVYVYNTKTNIWTTGESIPRIGSSGKKKSVKKGSVLLADNHTIYATKGNNTWDFWVFNCDSNKWGTRANVPVGTGKAIKDGSGMGLIGSIDRYIYLLKGSATWEFWRYHVARDSWDARKNAPAGTSGRPFKDGSALVSTGQDLYALKGSYNEFYQYHPAYDSWTTLTSLPLVGSSGRKRKARTGASLAYADGLIYCFKGGNTQEFWGFDCDSNKWVQLPDMPLGGGKKVKGGGALAPFESKVYGLKGNNTLEFWVYGSFGSLLGRRTDGTGANVQTSILERKTSACALSVAPNPCTPATRLQFSLRRSGSVSLKLYDLSGKLVATSAQGCFAAGSHVLPLGRPGLARGVYVLRLVTDAGSATTRLIVE